MHKALYIEEILLNIFGHCYGDSSELPFTGNPRYTKSLAALARVCRVFKEPALDVLWVRLMDPSPLVRCLPEVSCKNDGRYSFARTLQETEWDTLLSYTRRVWHLYVARPLTDENAMNILSSCPQILFPNLRFLGWRTTEPLPLVKHLGGSQLSELQFHLAAPPVSNISQFEGYLNSLWEPFPNLKRFSLHALGINSGPHSTRLHKKICDHILHWTNLHVVDCHQIALDMEVLQHLSRMPNLTDLRFTYGETSHHQFPSASTPLVFHNLRRLSIKSPSLSLVGSFLDCVMLPQVTVLALMCQRSPSKEGLRSSLLAAQRACHTDSLTALFIEQTRELLGASEGDNTFRLTFEDIEPCTVFKHLHNVRLDLECPVDLMNQDLLTLTSAWPDLEDVTINRRWGWRTTVGGIKPDGIQQLLEQCPSLHNFSLVIDTWNYTDIPPIPALPTESMLPSLRKVLTIHIVDAAIQPESVPALATFFGQIFPCPLKIKYHSSGALKRIHGKLWEDVYRLAHAKLDQRFPGQLPPPPNQVNR